MTQAQKIGRLFTVTTATPAQVLLIVSASQNTRGVLITSATLSVLTGGTGYLYADTVVPSAPGDTTKRLVWSYGNPPTNGHTSTFPYPMIIEPGLSIWLAAGTANATLIMTYDLMDSGP